MIEKIKGICVEGRLFDTTTNLDFFDDQNKRICIVYGKNGSGKSTISECFLQLASGKNYADLRSSCVTFDGKDFPILPNSSCNIAVFNEGYIDENIKVNGDSLGTIVLLGEQVDLQNEIDRIAGELKPLENNLFLLDQKRNQYLDEKNPNSQLYWLNQIKEILRQRGWAERERYIKGGKVNAAVSNETFNKIIHFKVEGDRNLLEKEFDENFALLKKVSDSTLSFPYAVGEISLREGWEKELYSLLMTEVDEPKFTDREAMILSKLHEEGKGYVEKIKNNFSDSQSSYCPYCFREITFEYRKDLLQSIDRVLNEEVKKLETRLKAFDFPDFNRDYSKFLPLSKELVEEVQKKLEKCRAISERYRDLLEEKMERIYSPLPFDSLGLSEAVQDLNSSLKELESKRREFNKVTSERENLQRMLSDINKKIARIDIEVEYQNYLKQQDLEKNVVKRLSLQRKEVENRKRKLDNLEKQKSNVGLAVASINKSLNGIFLANKRLSIEYRGGKYYLKVNGKYVAPKNVSQGERNIIALCYFFTKMAEFQEVGKLYQQESLVVIDDPVSSFDFDNKIGVMSFLMARVNDILKGNKKSKIIILTHDAGVYFDLTKIVDGLRTSFKSQGLGDLKYAFLELRDRSLRKIGNKMNHYKRLLEKIYTYANGNEPDLDLSVGNAARRVLEAFATFSFSFGASGIASIPLIRQKLGDRSEYFEALMYRLMLNGESHFEEGVYAIRDELNFFETYSEEEKRRVCRDVLCLMYSLNPEHLELHVKGSSDIIEKWMEFIPMNRKVEQ